MELSRIWVRNMEKKLIRKEIFAGRKLLTAEQIEQESHKITEKILAMDAYKNAGAVYIYVDCKGEASTKELMDAALKDGKKVAAPRVYGEDMKYFYISSVEDLEPGYFGIPEPKETLPLADDEEALLIVPGVAFDKERHRCGYGKGFYDRYLAKHVRHTTVAIALDFQVVEEVPCNEFDILPMVLCTPTAIYK